MTGLHLSHYAIEAELGRGGMGVVYRARDTKLNRKVALKVLPAAALASPDDRARFQREAQSAAALNHPNVCHVYEVDEAQPLTPEGKPVEGQTEKRLFIAMEFIGGQTLHDYVAGGPLKLQEAVNIAGQVAEALKEAHAKDIVHRDIKSANIMLTEGGVAKVLDFGLAKTNQSTMLTRMGSTLGTVAYMSPEQARGQEVDGRSDLYSLGTVLYEMVAGRLPYTGDYEQAILYGILNEAPEPLTSLRTGVPMQLEWIVDKLLKKEAEYRYQSAAGLLADLKSLDLSGSGRTQRSMAAVGAARLPSTGFSAMPKWVWVALTVAPLLGAGLAWTLHPSDQALADRTVRALQLNIQGYTGNWYEVSPDNKTLAFSGRDSLDNRGIFLVDLATGGVRRLAGGTGVHPLFSPDGSRVLFHDGRGLFVVPASGGTPLQVSPEANLATWTPDGGIVYERFGALWQQDSVGEDARQITFPDSTSGSHLFPSVLPDGRHLLFDAEVAPSRHEIRLLDLKTLEHEPLGLGTHPRYYPSGHLAYGGPGNRWGGPLMARAFDLDALAFTGPEVAVAEGSSPAWHTVDRAGTLYEGFRSDGNTGTTDLTIVGPDGMIEEGGISGPYDEPRLSPDQSRLAVVHETDTDRWLLIIDLETGVKRRITFSGQVRAGVWSADGTRLLLNRDGVFEIWSAGTGGLLETLPVRDPDLFDWSPDGNLIAYVSSDEWALRVFDRTTGDEVELEPHDTNHPRFSPDGRFVAYTRFVNGAPYASVQTIDGSGYVRLALDAERHRKPIWSQRTSRLFVEEGARGIHSIYAVPYTAAPEFTQTGKGEIVHERSLFIDEWDLGPDDRIYILGEDTQLSIPQNSQVLNVVVNWFEWLTETVPTSERPVRTR